MSIVYDEEQLKDAMQELTVSGSLGKKEDYPETSGVNRSIP